MRPHQLLAPLVALALAAGACSSAVDTADDVDDDIGRSTTSADAFDVGPDEGSESLTDAEPDAPISPLDINTPMLVGEVAGPVTSLQSIGDSILDWNTGEGASIVQQLADRIGVPAQQHAVSGATFDTFEPIGRQFRPGDTSHVLMTGGGNDLEEPCSREHLDEILSPDLADGDVIDVVDAISASGAQTIIMGYYAPEPDVPFCDVIPRLMERYGELAASRDDVVFVRTDTVITPNEAGLYDDGLHPSIEGGAAIADHLAEVLSEATSG